MCEPRQQHRSRWCPQKQSQIARASLFGYPAVPTIANAALKYGQQHTRTHPSRATNEASNRVNKARSSPVPHRLCASDTSRGVVSCCSILCHHLCSLLAIDVLDTAPLPTHAVFNNLLRLFCGTSAQRLRPYPSNPSMTKSNTSSRETQTDAVLHPTKG